MSMYFLGESVSLNTNLISHDLSKGLSLDNSCLYDVHLHSEYDEINKLRDYLFNFLSTNDSQFVNKNKTKNKNKFRFKKN